MGMSKQQNLSLCACVAAVLSAPACSWCPALTFPDPCDPENSTPTEHSGTIVVDEVWGAGLHLVTSTVTVGAGASLQVAACAVVRLAPDASIVVDDEAAGLGALGDVEQPVVFERADASAAWGALVAFAPATIQLYNTTLRGGGGTIADVAAAENAGASIAVRNQTGSLVDQLFVDNVVVEDSTGVGVMLQHTGFRGSSTGLIVRGAGSHPLYLGAGNATLLPLGDYVDNATPAILLQSVGVAAYDNTEAILHDATLPNRGVPYQVGPADVGADILVGDGRVESPSATLTIEPGVELRFRNSASALGQLFVTGKLVDGGSTEQGALIAVGTADAPIVFTSMKPSPAAGDWLGLSLRVQVSAVTRVEHVEVRYAGGQSLTTGRCVAAPGAANNDADGAVVVSVEREPPAFLADSLVANSAGCGVYRGWSGGVVDFASSNTFVDVAGCEQSNVPDDLGSCDTGTCQ
jgi:hypothetical protein